MNQQQVLNTILQQLLQGGISFIPIRADGSKKTALSQWKQYQERCPSSAEVAAWFRPDNERALAIVSGAVSKNLEVLDIDAKDIEPTLRARLTERGLIDLLNQMPCVRTPDGFHYYFRCSEKVEGNQKLAQRYVDGKCKVLIETRGEGGYAIAPGSPLATHLTGRPYELAAGSFDNIPVLSPQQRQEIFEVCRELDETAGSNVHVDGVRRTYNETADWDEILEPHGFILVRTHNGEGFWQKPDSSDTGHQLTTNYNGSDRLYNFSSACPPFKQEQFYDKFTAYALLNQDGVEKAAAHDLFSQGYRTTTKAKPEEGQSKENGFQKLMEIAKAQEIWLDQNNQVNITLRVNQHWESYPLNSSHVRDWLLRAYYDVCNSVVADETINKVISILRVKTEGLARRSRGVRVAQNGDCLYYDLCNEEWEYVEITKNGWSVKKEPGPARFVRTQIMQAAAHPAKSETAAAEFLKLLNLDAELDQPDLLLAFMLFSLVPQWPHPLLILQGEQGTGKSLTAKAIRKVIDPCDPPLIAPPNDEDDLVVIANQTHVLAFDNLSGLKHSLSDAFCRLSSGTGLMKRKLYTDDEAVPFKGIRPVILNGIDEIAERDDLIERSIILELPLIGDKRRSTEDEFFAAIQTCAPGMLGFLFDCLSCMLRELPATKLESLPRMADFIKCITAAEPSIGWGRRHFLEVFSRHQNDVIELKLQSDPLVDALKAVIAEGDFDGTATQLLDQLKTKAAEYDLPELPNSASTLGRRLKRLAPSLRKAGIEVVQRRARKRNIEIRRKRKTADVAVAAVDDMVAARNSQAL